MKFIDIFDLSKYLKRTGDNQTARVGHVNYVIKGLTEEIAELTEEIAEAVTRDYVAETGIAAVSGLNKINNYNVTVQGTEFDVYSLQGYTQLSGSNAYVIPIGYITTSSSNVGISSNSSNVLALDSVLQRLVTSLGFGALVTDADPLSITFGQVIPVSFMGINIDNAITTPDEYYIFLLAGDVVPFECDAISINLELTAVAGSTVEYNVI
jgi:hypothetical protein